jgi:acyl-CoA reductase-like NAD-dependent aldehyde dehydrogenase
MKSHNPAAGDLIETHGEHSSDEIETQLNRAERTYQDWWREKDITVRERLLRR